MKIVTFIFSFLLFTQLGFPQWISLSGGTNAQMKSVCFTAADTGYIAAGSSDPGSTLFGSSDIGLGLPIKSLLTPLYLVPVTPVPEPATIALAGLGGLALLALRRKK